MTISDTAPTALQGRNVGWFRLVIAVPSYTAYLMLTRLPFKVVGNFDPKFDPEFDPEFDPKFDPKINPKFDPKIDPKFDPVSDAASPPTRLLTLIPALAVQGRGEQLEADRLDFGGLSRGRYQERS